MVGRGEEIVGTNCYAEVFFLKHERSRFLRWVPPRQLAACVLVCFSFFVSVTMSTVLEK